MTEQNDILKDPITAASYVRTLRGRTSERVSQALREQVASDVSAAALRAAAVELAPGVREIDDPFTVVDQAEASLTVANPVVTSVAEQRLMRGAVPSQVLEEQLATNTAVQSPDSQRAA